MHILLTNDDGIHAPGLIALEKRLRKIGSLDVIAPATEQSGVGHSITFLSPLTCNAIMDGDRQRGWAVEGTPADCVKIALAEFCDQRPDLVVSGINGGLNAGINVHYSGTVSAAVEGAFFGITSIAVSLESDANADFESAADITMDIIQSLKAQASNQPRLYNVNIPTAAIRGCDAPRLKVVRMGLAPYGQQFIKRTDPKGRDYFWATGKPGPELGSVENDYSELKKGFVTITPLQYDMTCHSSLPDIQSLFAIKSNPL